MEHLMEFGKWQELLKLPQIPQVSHTPVSFPQTKENHSGECECVWPRHQWTTHNFYTGDTQYCLNALCGCEYKQWPCFEHDIHIKIHKDRWLYYVVTLLIQANTPE